jgi:hypothetical protein
MEKIKPTPGDQVVDLFLPPRQLCVRTCTPAYKIGIRVPVGVTGVGSLS